MGVVVLGIGIVSPRWSAAEAGAGEWEIPSDAVPADKRARIGRLDRLCRSLLQASYLAVADAGLEIEAVGAERVGLCFGTGLGCLLTNTEFYEKVVEQGPKAASPRLFAYTVSSAAAGEVSIALGIKGPNTTEHAGLAAGLSALGHAFDLIEADRADVVLAGGGDACGPALVEALQAMGLYKTQAEARPFVDAVPGIHPSEAAVVLVLASDRIAAAPPSALGPPDRAEAGLGRAVVAADPPSALRPPDRADPPSALGPRAARPQAARSAAHRFDLPPRFAIAGYAAGFEPSLAGRAPQSRGIAETMRRALAQAGIAPGAVDVVVCSAHGTPADAAELAAVRDVLGERALVLAPKAWFGETFAASPLLGLALLEATRNDGRRSAPPAGGPPALPEALAWGAEVARAVPPPALPEALERGAEVAPAVPPPALPEAFERGAEVVPAAPAAGLAELRALPGSLVVMLSAVCYSGPVVSLLLTRRE